MRKEDYHFRILNRILVRGSRRGRNGGWVHVRMRLGMGCRNGMMVVRLWRCEIDGDCGYGDDGRSGWFRRIVD